MTVLHRIHDPEGFQDAEAKALEAGLPAGVALPVHAATPDHQLGICIWEGESVAAVREVVEGAVGAWAENEYYEMHVDGLTPQLSHEPRTTTSSASAAHPLSISGETTMAYAVIHHFPGGTRANYEASVAAVHPGPDEMPKGQIAHVAGAVPGGWTIVAVHESKEDWEQFRDGTLLPKLTAGVDGGFPTPPEETTIDVYKFLP